MENAESSTTSTTWASSADVNNDLAEANVIVSKLSDEALLKMKVIQNLLEKVENIKPWLFRVQPYQGESLSHFLGRFRQENDLTPTGLGKAAGLGGAIARWEKFRFNPLPSRQQLEALAKVVEVDADRGKQDIKD